MIAGVKTGIIFGAIVLIGIAGISAVLTTLDEEPTSGVGDLERAATPLNPAPVLVGIADYLNTTPDELDAKIDGSVVLYDIWTYSCINGVRTLPYITSWHDKYKDDGLVVIGIHSPEFEFEKDRTNVERAVAKHGITYPVVMDNDMETWKAFENRYWPRKYITDHEGNIRYDHIGEGDYENTERVIQQLLRERADELGVSLAGSDPDTVDVKPYANEGFTRELYFGYKFAYGRDRLGNEEGFVPQADITYAAPAKLRADHFYLEGTWKNLEGSMKLISDSGAILLPYHAKQVNIVAGSAVPTDLRVYLDSLPIDPKHQGVHIREGLATIDDHGLYNIVSSPGAEMRTLELRVSEPGFEIFTFTFG